MDGAAGWSCPSHAALLIISEVAGNVNPLIATGAGKSLDVPWRYDINKETVPG
jgi:hypothetical protein